MQVSDKDQLIICKKADHETPSKYELPPPLPNESRRGVLLPNGEINWTCPCLGVLPYGPCAYEFRQFFTCLPPPGSEKDETKQEECIPQFRAMMDCMREFPQVYPPEKQQQKEEQHKEEGEKK